MYSNNYFYSSDLIEILLYLYAFLVMIIIGGVLILFERNKLGGAISLFNGIFMVISCVFFSTIITIVSLLAIFGGLMGLFGKINVNIENKVLSTVSIFGSIRISELSNKLRITEADAELSVINLQRK